MVGAVEVNKLVKAVMVMEVVDSRPVVVMELATVEAAVVNKLAVAVMARAVAVEVNELVPVLKAKAAVGTTPGGGGDNTGGLGDGEGGGGGGGDTNGGDGGGGGGRNGTKGLHLNELQSTFFFKNALHWPSDLCLGRSGKQFLLSSKSGNRKHTGASPLRQLTYTLRDLAGQQIMSHIELLSPTDSGNGPCSSLKLTSNTVRFFSRPISSGKQDLNPLFNNKISLSLDMLTMLVGRHPPNWLFATTITDTGEFPKLSGISNRNLLLLIKIASRSLSNNSLGTLPSNSLNLRSRYFNEGSVSTTFGNFPARRLLLRSSSYNSTQLFTLCGTVPQNRFEFTWNNARSLSNPSSSGRNPAMSP
ncbi:hypothetical protein AKJ16_DCAP26043 [Drosera capensis]